MSQEILQLATILDMNLKMTHLKLQPHTLRRHGLTGHKLQTTATLMEQPQFAFAMNVN